MINLLKKQPLIGLALAIAGGYVLAHILIQAGDYLYENNPAAFLTWCVLFVIAVAIYSMRKRIRAWARDHLMASPEELARRIPPSRLANRIGKLCALFCGALIIFVIVMAVFSR